MRCTCGSLCSCPKLIYVCPLLNEWHARYKIISAIGVKIAKITPSRGFAIELGSAMMVIIGTRLEIPLSTTHCQVSYTARSQTSRFLCVWG